MLYSVAGARCATQASCEVCTERHFSNQLFGCDNTNRWECMYMETMFTKMAPIPYSSCPSYPLWHFYFLIRLKGYNLVELYPEELPQKMEPEKHNIYNFAPQIYQEKVCINSTFNLFAKTCTDGQDNSTVHLQ